MSKSTVGAAQGGSKDQLLFWGCFVALVTTAFGFIARMFLIGTWEKEFTLDPAESGRLAGIGIWPFAVSIIGFSLVIDKVGYKIAMFAAFFGHLLWAVMGVSAQGLVNMESSSRTARNAKVACCVRICGIKIDVLFASAPVRA